MNETKKEKDEYEYDEYEHESEYELNALRDRKNSCNTYETCRGQSAVHIEEDDGVGLGTLSEFGNGRHDDWQMKEGRKGFKEERSGILLVFKRPN